MQNTIDVKFDITNMTLEEMEVTRNNILETLHHITMKKMANHKYSSKPSKPTNQEAKEMENLHEKLTILNHHIVMIKIANRKYSKSS